ncbi:FAD-binding protein [Tranquillimonas alkanivorans]|uniref:FAD-binding protein n=1 Tax=Tranquillimonas alkanivorans TaxID=441119 RepID=UPI000B818D00|nr:FAD-binding protein [Tranquillimonas alkanivorans]
MTPDSETELAEVVRTTDGPLRIIGGGTRSVGRPVTGEALSVAGLSGVTLHEPGALTLVARAGTPVAEVEEVLAGAGQRLPFEPVDHRALLGTEGQPTLGGMVAANASGPRRVQAGACRDFLLGVRFVDGSGEVVKNGGRVMKNVTGYDLVKLMAGSWGTLGVLTEVSFKVLPRTAEVATLRLRGLSDDDAVRALTAGLGSPFEVTGAAHDPQAGETMLRIEGFADSVAYRAGRLGDVLAPFGEVEVERDPEHVRAAWRRVRDVEAFADRAGDVWRVSVKPSDGPELARRAGAEAVLYDWGGGLVWLLTPEGRDLRPRIDGLKGHATLVRAAEATRASIAPFPPEPAPVAALTTGLRRKFDPRGILNPGLMD